MEAKTCSNCGTYDPIEVFETCCTWCYPLVDEPTKLEGNEE